MSLESNRPASRSAAQIAQLLAAAAIVWAAIVFRVVANDGLMATWLLSVVIGLELMLFGGIAVWLRRIPGFSQQPSQQATLVVIWTVAVLLFRIGQRQWGNGLPWELVLMSAARHLMVALIVCGCTLRLQRLAMLLSLFLIVFTASITSRSNAAGMLAIYCVPATAWLMFQEWQRFSSRLLDADSVRPRKHWLIWTLPLVGLLIVGFSFADDRALQQIRGWVPTSGGDGTSDQFARDGVGDGDALVPGEKNIKSVAAIEDAPFLADDRPSLYDVYEDTYEPEKPPTATEKAISLDPTEAERGSERIAKYEQSGREFSTLRQDRSSSSHRLKDKSSPAQFHVAGRVPLHLRVEVYDLFDGLKWYPAVVDDPPVPMQIKLIGERHWLTVSPYSAAWFSQPEYHVLKMIRYGSPVIPTPLHTTGVHIDRIQREDMYRWHQPGIPALDRTSMPPLLPIRLASKVADLDLVSEPRPQRHHTTNDSLQLPEVRGIQTISKLAKSWTQGCEPGWEEVDAIVGRLKSDYVHDRNLQLSKDEQMPLLRFLTEVKAGPDYQFATAAAMLLRSQGYRCRVVSGFYADPDQYDRRTRLTPVHDDDVHFWVELNVGVSTWVTLDPTPGYEVLNPPRSWSQQVWAGIIAVVSWIGRHPGSAIVVVIICVLLWRYRIPIQDALMTAWCFTPLVRGDSRCFATFDLLNQRLEWAGVARPAHRSPKQWWAQLGLLDEDAHRLMDRIEARVFAGRVTTDGPQEESRALCLRLLQRWKLSELRRRTRPIPSTSTTASTSSATLEPT